MDGLYNEAIHHLGVRPTLTRKRLVKRHPVVYKQKHLFMRLEALR